MTDAMIFLGILLSLAIPIIFFLWLLKDLSHPPSTRKAFTKVLIGVTISAIFIFPHGNHSPVAVIMGAVGVIGALLGAADMAASRRKQTQAGLNQLMERD